MKKRVISAVIALIISIPLIYKGGTLFYVFACCLALIGLREVLNLIVKDNITKILCYIIFLTIIGSNLFKTNFDNILSSNIIGIVFLIFALTILYNHKNKDFDINKGFYLMGITLFLSVAFSSIIITRNINIKYLIYILILPFSNDTFAHLIGSKIGKHKINEISPNKSWEGCIAGLVFGTLISTLFYLIVIDIKASLFLIIKINLLLSILGQLGDLFFSLIKRNYKIKDFSNLMPGHGGVLDRLDSVIFVSLGFIYFITLL